MTEVGIPREERIRRALDHLRNDTTDEFEHVTWFEPVEFTDPDIAKIERERVFGRVPSIIIHGSEIPRAGDFVTLQLPRNNVIIVRQRDGSVKTLVNQCRHRGAMVEKEEKGRCRLFSCPYHRWSYDTDGSLRTITRDNTFGDADRSERNLVQLPTEERHGFVWVVDDADATIDVADWLGPEMDSIMGSYGMDKMVTTRVQRFDEPINWKLMQDAFLDGYHIQYAHPNTAAKHIHTNVMAFEDFGNHCRFLNLRKTIDRWIEEDPGDRSLAEHITESHLVGPNSTLLKQPDHFQLLTFRPHRSDPQRCHMEIRLVAPTLEESGMTEERWNRIWDKNVEILVAVLHNEDFPILRDSQVAMDSANAGNMLLGRNEVANQVFRRAIQKLVNES
ncbi:aromatic ring-hydroxylating dioxygenase subunit alpha [Rhodococcus sp. NPDC019627]|jgi:phenylpropionate dioxygenase-like ring-hydroxylating dioxygenase large terminal subunit|uniref:aromatic ring-hydroxylating oxygenase subunit alpha n=1 Tax=unclassified Rhodococcus (in: high G+C Gram-positive bacteria) TaxID=192944 RepID=UPI00203072C1|nr:SRPBCC family protein [Rhodococcus sp. MSC1_016]